MNILVAGGAGFIGTHTCVELMQAGYNVIVADNLCNSRLEAVQRAEQIVGRKLPFYQLDITDETALEQVFQQHQIDGIIHFAGLKAVGESVQKPIAYYRNNLDCTLVLCKMMQKFQVKRLVFSSSATVYGNNTVPFTENMPLKPATNPYGETKVVSERILQDFAKANPDYAISILRYFNPIGAHESGLLGEEPWGIPNNLMPYISQVADGILKELRIFGNDYPTIDGTGVRDYIHVVDLAKGHVKALEYLENHRGISIHNLGTGKGTSVLELVHTFEQVNQVKVPYRVVERRAGDIAECYASVEKAERELNWKAEKTLEDMCRDAWRWQNCMTKGQNERFLCAGEID